MTTMGTPRERAKAERSEALIHAAATLFAERGYAGVSLEEVGAAVGVSGPAVYRHFTGKAALLAEILITVSRRLFDGGAAMYARSDGADSRIDDLIRFHVDFALANADIIRVHDREFSHLIDSDRAEVKRLQRAYVDLWIQALRGVQPAATPDELRLRVQAALGLMNSTPHSLGRATRTSARAASLLESMAHAALHAEGSGRPRADSDL